MKKLVLLPLVVGLFSFSGIAQKIGIDQIPVIVKNKFIKQYPGVTAKWEKEKANFEANFKKGSQVLSVLYDAQGNLVETELDIKPTALPKIVKNYVKANYKNSIIKEGAKITKADGTLNYEAEVNGKDLIFDSMGNFLKESKN